MKYSNENLDSWLRVQNAAMVASYETFRHGGHTFWYDGVERVTGYVVGNNNDPLIPGFGSTPGDRIDIDELQRQLLTVYRDNVECRDDDDEEYDGVGTWLDREGVERTGFGGKKYQDTDLVYFDNVTHKEGIHEAMRLAQFNGEIAIYDLEDGECINVAEWLAYQARMEAAERL